MSGVLATNFAQRKTRSADALKILQFAGLVLSRLAALGLTLVALVHPASAQRAPFESVLTPDVGKLPLTAGFSDVDGAGGGGLVPWAIITGYGTADSYGANVHYTAVPLRDFRLQSFGVAVGALDRIEVSYAKDLFDATSGALNGVSVEQQIFGLKVRLTGDAVYDQDSWAPQTAVGLEYKRNSGLSGLAGVTNVRQLGADGDSSIDYYLSATKVLLAQSLLLNLTLRYTDANEFGILGFGGDLHQGRSVEPEGTLAYILTRKLAIGTEYRAKPRNLSVDDERGAWDAFVAWTPTRHASIVAGFASLGSILSPVTHDTHSQNGGYVSLQVGF